MLEHSFVHLKGVGPLTEERLWNSGVRTWSDLSDCAHEHFGPKKINQVLLELEESRAALDAGELRYFQSRLKSAEMWRLLPLCEGAIAYLDIETTGLGFPPECESTTIAVYFQGELFVEHESEKKRQLLKHLDQHAKMFVTFNGLSFDLPFLRRETGLALSHAHLDLRVWLRRHGLTGGLKKIQSSLPQIHQRTSQDIDGFDAVRLWRMHKRGVPKALETLMTYNAEDTIVLEALVHLAYEFEVSAKSFLPLKMKARPVMPTIATQVDDYVYEILRGRESWDVPARW